MHPPPSQPLKLPITFIPTPDAKLLPLNFILSDCPSPDRQSAYIAEFRRTNVHHLIRICDTHFYDATAFEKESAYLIKVHDEIKFEDGKCPSVDLVNLWLDLVTQILQEHTAAQTTILPTVAIHCVSGLGRAPVLAAIAILEFTEQDVLDVIEFLRSHRRGSLNATQIKWLEGDFDRQIRRKHIKARMKRINNNGSSPRNTADLDTSHTKQSVKLGLRGTVKSWFH